jgi:Rrf2 family protein
MMKISTKGQYSLKAMVELAAGSEEELLSISQLAQRTGVTEHYLEQLLPKLRAAGLIESTRGAQGGYRLTRPADRISVGEVLRAGEGDLIPVDCVLTNDKACDREQACVVKYVWKKVMDSINDTVDGISLAELAAMRQ